MDAVIRSIFIYLALLVITRLSGKRSLSQITVFDFILILIIGEATQQALLGNDFSTTNAALVIITLIMIDVGFSLIMGKYKWVGKLFNSVPLIILENGVPIKERMEKARVSESDILSQARKLQGLERLDQIKYAVLERDGGISIIPQPSVKG